MRVKGTTKQALAFVSCSGSGRSACRTSTPTARPISTSRRRQRPLIERPVEPPEPEGHGFPFCVLDVETTGFKSSRDSIIEIAVIRCEDGREQVLSALVRPSGNIPKRIREVTGITNEMVADAETIDKVLPKVAELVGDAPIVAHNAHFDRRFVEHNARLMGLSFTGNEWICTMRMAQRVPTGGPYGLGALAAQLDVPASPTHRALDDCRATVEVYRVAREQLGGDVSLAPMASPDDEPAPAEVNCDADLSGQVFVFSGFRDEILAARIGNAGGHVAGGISRKVTRLLVESTEAPPTGKARKATEYGIPIRSKAAFEAEFYV